MTPAVPSVADTGSRAAHGTSPFATMRGPLDTTGFPRRLCRALARFDTIRRDLARGGRDYDAADEIALLESVAGPDLVRLARGVRRLSWRGCHTVARTHSGVCRTYTRGKMDVFTSLNGLFWWNDGKGETRRRLLLLAWRKGRRP